MSDSDAVKLIEHVRQHGTGDKLLTTKEELLTPKGKAELAIVDSITLASKFVARLLSEDGPAGVTAAEQSASASHAKTQLTAAMWVLDKAMGMVPRQNGRPVRDAVGQIQVNAVTAALAKRLAQKQHAQSAQRRERARFIEAVPAQASDEHTSVSDTNAQDVAADGVSPAADSGDQG